MDWQNQRKLEMTYDGAILNRDHLAGQDLGNAVLFWRRHTRSRIEAIKSARSKLKTAKWKSSDGKNIRPTNHQDLIDDYHFSWRHYRQALQRFLSFQTASPLI